VRAQKREQSNGEKTEYGNWVSKRIIFLSGFLGFTFLGLGLMFWVLIIPAVLFIFGQGFLIKTLFRSVTKIFIGSKIILIGYQKI